MRGLGGKAVGMTVEYERRAAGSIKRRMAAILILAFAALIVVSQREVDKERVWDHEDPEAIRRVQDLFRKAVADLDAAERQRATTTATTRP